MNLEPGRRIGEQLRLLRIVGRGAMGSVWVAEHLGLRSQVAVKFMAQAMLEDPVSLQRFQQEATAAAEIRSPHVVRVFDHGTTSDGVPFIVMELLDGESLEQRLRRDGALPLADVATIVHQTVKALAKAHERGIVHRDIKPGNVFLTGDEEIFVKVLDFGVAKFSGHEAVEMTTQGNMVGTPVYMSPEQLFEGRSVDHRADLWSLAVVAYLAITGERPFNGTTLGELCVAIRNGDFVPPSRLRPGLPPEIDAWFAKAFARSVEGRFATARELSAAFQGAAGLGAGPSSTPSLSNGALPVTASSSGTAFPAAATPRRLRGTWLAAVSGGALVLAVVTAVALLRNTGAGSAPTGSVTGTPVAVSEPLPVGTRSGATVNPAAAGAASPILPSASVSAAPSAPVPAASTAPRAPTLDARSRRAAQELGL